MGRKNYPPKAQQQRKQGNRGVGNGVQKLRYNFSQSPFDDSKDPKEEFLKALEQLNGTANQCDYYYYKKRLDYDQKDYFHAVLDNPVVVIDEEAGKGKTFVGMMAGVKLLREKKVDRLMYLRFPDDEGEKMGFTPGELEAKESKYMTPAYDALQKCGLQPEAIDLLKRFGLIVMTTDATLRGCNLERTFLFMDETQNGTISGIQKVLTRLHDQGGRAVLAGHSGQVDNRYLETYGSTGLIPFQVYQCHMLKQDFAVRCTLSKNYRGRISQWADKINETIKELEG